MRTWGRVFCSELLKVSKDEKEFFQKLVENMNSGNLLGIHPKQEKTHLRNLAQCSSKNLSHPGKVLRFYVFLPNRIYGDKSPRVVQAPLEEAIRLTSHHKNMIAVDNWFTGWRITSFLENLCKQLNINVL
jgi:hypothetical protein